MTLPNATGSSWIEVLSAKLSLFGHRNWIVIADSAYPSQSAPGMTTILADADHLDVARQVLAAIDASGHVRAKTFTDSELRFVSEHDAPGVEKFRASLHELLQRPSIQTDAHTIEHEEVIDRLASAASKFEVLVIKTPLKIPYSSIFLELDCGYWTADADARLRATMDSWPAPD